MAVTALARPASATEDDVPRLTRKTVFAIEAVLDIAYNGGPEPAQSREITQRQGIPARYLEQVLQQLVHAGILTGVRGPRGGYRLARERRRISVGEVVRVVHKMEDPKEQTNNVAGSALSTQVVHPLWLDLQREFERKLDGISIEDLCQRAHKAGVDSENARRLNYMI